MKKIKLEADNFKWKILAYWSCDNLKGDAWFNLKGSFKDDDVCRIFREFENIREYGNNI